MTNATPAKRRTPTPLIIAALLALAAILSIMSAVPVAIPTAVHAQTVVDYDTDDDGYIEVNSLAKLRAIRFDLNGDGAVSVTDSSGYGNAFPNRGSNPATRMGCPSGACVGYELTGNLTFDENGDGQMTQAGDPTYWNSGAGWDPIGTDSARYTGDFKGNGFTIDYLRINRTGNDKGLFGVTSSTARIESVGITNANVTGDNWTGILVGANHGEIVACYTTGSVTVNTGTNKGNGVGGLAAHTSAAVSSSYSSAAVSGLQRAGGLIGQKAATGSITNSYSTGAVTRPSGALTTIGGLVGESLSGTGTVTASYFDSTTSGCVTGGTAGCTTSAAGTAQTTSNLQSVTGYTGIYADWNANLDSVPGNDDPWDFKGSSAYPTLIYHLTDYDTDEDNLIEISNLAQLNAIRLNLNGRGDSTQSGYTNAFPNRSVSATKRLGCPAGNCRGYELAANLDFDENGDGQITQAGDPTYWNSNEGWEPIGSDDSIPARFQTTFKGNGYTINNLFINRARGDVGLFGAIHTNARIESLAVTNANVTGRNYTGILVGSNYGEIVACYTTGAVAGATNYDWIGGLAGWIGNAGAPSIHSSYSTASVSGDTQVGGLTGQVARGDVTNSYSIGSVTGGSSNVGGLIGSVTGTGSASASYWNTTTSGQSTSAGGSGATGKTTAELQSPTAYGAASSDTYFGWNANIDGSPGNDDPWDFGSSTTYPALKFGGHSVIAQNGLGDYDTNDDGYIEITTLAQLNVIRHDLNGDGVPTSGGATAYNAAFPDRETGVANYMGCPSGTCTGYELTANLDFDENGDGQITQAGDPTYWDGGKGWQPIGADSSPAARYSGDFKGNGYTINNLFIDRGGQDDVGLFGAAHTTSRIETLGVTNASVRGDEYIGILTGSHYGAVVACYTTGAAIGAHGTMNTQGTVGGLVGYTNTSSSIHSSYSTASVTGNATLGGLVGRLRGSLTNSYSTGRVTRLGGGSTGIGGLIGWGDGSVSITNSYWNTQTAGQSKAVGNNVSGSVGKTTRELQSPDAYAGIYANWNANLDGNTGGDNPWFFGSFTQYPTLIYGTTVDYDADDDGYIDISNIAQLDATRQDLDGNGNSTHADYIAAFPRRDANAATRMGCPTGTCTGYELIANLEFDSNADGDVNASDHSGRYHNSGAGWEPIGDAPVFNNSATRYQADFKGNGHTVNNLFINRSTTYIGLFGVTHSTSRIETLGVTNANVTGLSRTGILVGFMYGEVVACYTTGAVTTTDSTLGSTGGLVGFMYTNSTVSSSYSTASSSGLNSVGGLVGRTANAASITNSYATGRVTRDSGNNPSISGLVGWVGSNNDTVTASYWDVTSSGQTQSHNIGATSTASIDITGKTPRELQTVTDYSGIFAAWNIDLDGDNDNDDPWDFGNGMQYPMLKYDSMSTDPQGGQAMGVPDNWNAPVAGERVGVCLTPDDFPNRGIVSGQTYHEAWVWERSLNGDTWEVISGAGDGDNPPTYEYTPGADDIGRYIRAKVKMTDGSFATTRALGGRVVSTSGATAGAEIRFRYGHAAPQVGVPIAARDPVPGGAVDSRFGWQRCDNNDSTYTDCANIPHVWWVSYTPTAADVGKYLRMYVYYETADGTWTRHVTPFTTGVVAR